MNPLESILPRGVRSRFVEIPSGLTMHILEAGFESVGRPLIMLLHGFPELAFSWRRIIPELAKAGYHVVAPDQRGYGRTMGWNGNFDDDLEPFRLLNIAKDALGLVFALGRRTVDGLVGHDFGSLIAATCALVRPDVFRSVVLMSAPFAGASAIGDSLGNGSAIDDALAALNPPRKHYRWHHATRSAEADILDCKQGLHDFLRAYYHVKSADWSGNQPFPLNSWTASELSKLPTYYIMDREADMASTVAPYMPSTEEISRCEWLPDNVLGVSTAEFSRTGFQGALNCYRVITEPRHASSLEMFDGRTIDVPSLFISGASDWGVYQIPHGFAKMRSGACTRLHGCHLIEGAGHWVQQEQPERVVELLREFFARYASSLAA